MTRHRSSPILLVSLAIITLISSVAANIGTAHAASSVLLYSDMDTNQKIISYEFYKSLSSCVNDTDYSATRKSVFTASEDVLNNARSVMGLGSTAEIDAEIVKTPTTSNADIFAQIFNHSKTNGYNIGLQAEAAAKKNGAKIGDSTNGIVSCEEIAKAAYSFWGLDSKGLNGIYSMLSAMGFKSSYNPETDNGYVFWSISTKPAFNEYIKSEIYGGKDIVLDDGLQYYLYKYYFFEKIGCGATVYTTGDNLYVGGTSFSGAQYATVKASLFKEGSKSILEKTYKLNKTTMEVGNTNIPIHFETSKTCSEIASSLTKMTKKIDKENTYDKYVTNIKDAENEIKEKTEASQESAGDLSDSTKTSCAIGGVGWIVCPVSNFLANIADGAFHYLSGNFLEVKSQAFDTSNTTYDAWSAMRNIANVLFVIVFLAIIFSQMSGFGITNYGVKKMLPRLIVAAILVNTSYFICQIAIDISNIVGYSLDNMLKNFATSAIGSSGTAEDGSYFSSIIATVLGATGTLVLAALSITIPMIIAAVAALIMIVFLLVSRQAVVILLVVVAPIAFVAYLLPNTNSLFKQWKKIFLAMLMLFPIIALVFGASSMAATILSGAFDDSGSSIIGPVIVAAINVLPLFAVPVILKKSLNSVGNIGATINGLGAKLGGAATQQYQKSNAGQFMKYRQSQIEQNRTNAQAGIYKGRNPYRSAVSAINRGANTALKTGFGGKLLKNFAMSAESRGKSILDKEFEEQVSIAAASQKNMSYDSIKAIATGANAATEAERTAAIRVGLQKGAYSERKEIYKSIKTNDTDRIKTSATDGFFAQKDQQFFGAGMAGDIATGGIDEAKLIQNMAKSASKFSAETLVEDANASADIYKALQLNSGDIQEIFKSDNAEKTQQNIASYYKAASDLPQIAKNIPSSTVLQSKLNGEKSANIAKIAGLGVSSTTVDKS